MAAGDQECDLCKVTYSSKEELEEHNWSLMHHIKIEKIQKGAPHSCNLCKASCANIIEYGKHLNEDKHHLALKRRSGGGQEELLDSFSNQSELLGRDTSEADMEIEFQSHQGHFNHGNKHSRSLSQPDLHDSSLLGEYQYFQQGFRHPGGGGPQQQSHNQGFYQHFHGKHGGHSFNSSPHMGSPWNQWNGMNDGSYFQDDSLNWEGNQFQVWNNDGYQGYPAGNQGRVWEKGNKGRRRGSFDDNFDRSFNNGGSRRRDFRNGNRDDSRHMGDSDCMLDRRGRGWQRGAHGRTSSYDQNLDRRPNRFESRSSDRLDDRNVNTFVGRSDLKRRNEEDYDVHPEKSRRGNEDTRSGRSSRSLSPSARYERGRMAAERDVSEGRKVTWSDQQCVSSTTDPEMEQNLSGKKKGRGNVKGKPRSQSPADRATNYANMGKRKGKKKFKNVSRNEVLNDVDSADLVKSAKSQNDSTESVLEKAEKLCQKLRQDREKLKKQQAKVEKQKKVEKTKELNTQINKLSNINRENIRGHLDTVKAPVHEKLCVKPLEVNAPPKSTSVLEKAAMSMGILSSPSTPSGTPTPEDELRKGIAKVQPRVQTPEPSISDRLAQTRKEIDSIRAKIEGSVHTESATSVPTSSVPTSPQQRSLCHSDIVSPGTKVSPFGSSKKTDHNALLKMVKSPRSTKERLTLANMLRDHAKSQKKLSLPRFNLKFSDLCTGSDQPEALADFDLETLAPSVQLEIANLIEADVKPDVAELEKLLESASAINGELDMNLLNELGLLNSPLVSENRNRMSSPSTRARSPLHGSPSPGDLTLFGEVYGLPDMRSPSPKGNKSDRDRLTVDDLGSERLLSVEDLTMVGNKPVEHLARDKSPSRPQSRLAGSLVNRKSPEQTFSSSLPVSVQNTSTSNVNTIKDDTGINSFNLSVVKQEKIDAGYEKSAVFQLPKVSSRFDPYKYDPKSREESIEPPTAVRDTVIAPDGRVLPIRRSKHTEKLFSSQDNFEPPTRDIDRMALTSQTQSDPTLTGSSVHDAYRIPALVPSTDGASLIPAHRDREPSTSPQPLDRSLGDTRTQTLEERPSSQTEFADPRSALEKVTAILDGVPSVETVISGPRPTVGQTHVHLAEKDKDLDMSLSSQTSSVLEQVYNISVQEETVRSDISGIDQKIGQLQSLIDEAEKQLSTFTHRRNELLTQEKEFRNTRMKLLAESRSLQGSTSSQGSYGRQTLPGLSTTIHSQLQNNPVMMRYMMSQEHPAEFSSLGGFSNVESGSQSEMDAVSQRRRSIDSDMFHPSKQPDRDSGTPIPSDSSEKGRRKPETEGNSFSLLNKPLDKSGFITLEALMKGDSDIGKLLHKSLESIEKGKIPQEGSPLEKQTSNESQSKESSAGGRNRSFSIGSEDLLYSGSDGERKGGKVSMKYMGELPGGVSYDTFVKQMTKDNKNKPLLFTVLSSPSGVKGGTDSGLGTGSVSSNMTPTSVQGSKLGQEDVGYKSDHSSKTTSTNTLTADMDNQSVKSGYSLGEQIKRICDSQGTSIDQNQTMDLLTPRSDSSGEKTLEDESSKIAAATASSLFECPPPRNQYFKTDGTLADTVANDKNETDKRKKSTSPEAEKLVIDSLSTNTFQNPRQIILDAGSPTRKRLKSKKERDQRSRRKQKENFILFSDTNSEGDNETNSNQSKTVGQQTTLSEEDLVITGSEDCRTPRVGEVTLRNEDVTQGREVTRVGDMVRLSERTKEGEITRVGDMSEMKRSLLDEVQLETETQSDEERSGLADHPSPKSSESVKYKGPHLSVACMQVFKGDLYVCYNGTEIRRFNLKTGEILKELDCSPYLVHTMTICDVKEREDILYTAGAFHKLMLFEPQKFTLLGTFDYTERILCLHENWERLFLGLSDGSVSVRSLKTDKELNVFSCAVTGVQCLASMSAGMTKMLCLGTTDHVIYVVDAITGLLITMLEGHTQSPLCLQVIGERVFSSAADKTLIAHSASAGEMLKSVRCDKPIVRMWMDQTSIYTACRDDLIRCYNMDLKMTKVINTESGETVTCGIVHGGTLITGFRNGLAQSVVM